MNELDPDDDALIASLRALPQEGIEPDWAELEQQIRLAVGPQVPLPWWRSWRWLVPIGALASITAASVILLAMHQPSAPHETTPVAIEAPVHVVPTIETSEARGTVVLDGEAIDVDNVDPSVLILDDSDEFADGLMPAGDLRWVDSLDDHALDRVEDYLDHAKHGKG
ncbi:MAG TPA: hypothetical protein VGC41_14670 [Kofleriaceae bacterium]